MDYYTPAYKFMISIYVPVCTKTIAPYTYIYVLKFVMAAMLLGRYVWESICHFASGFLTNRGTKEQGLCK
jgi:hypothetical protein